MIVILGHSGQVARSLRLQGEKEKKPYLSTSSKPERSQTDKILALDLGSKKSVEDFFRALDQKKIDRAEVFLPGALTNVDRCETEQELSRRINRDGPIWVGEECKRRGWPLAFFSTEYVFGADEYQGGKGDFYSEEHPMNPSSYYGRCKMEAEQGLQSLGLEQLLLLRTTMVFSYDKEGMNFFMQLFRHLSRLEKGEVPENKFRIAIDQISTPTFADSLARNSLRLMAEEKRGIYNLVGADRLSRWDLLELVIEQFGFSREKMLPGFEKKLTHELGQAAKRPLLAGLRSDKARAEGLEVLTLKEAFQQIRGQMQNS